MKVIGIDLGGTKLATVLFDVQGNMIHKQLASLDNRKGSEVGLLITSELKKMLSEHKNVVSVGVSVPGIYHQETGEVWAPNIPDWEEYPLRDELTSLLEGDDISVVIDSDRSCYILGEIWKGNAVGCKNAIFIAVGTGIGAGIMANGQILQGIGNSAGAVGWMALDRPHRQPYTKYGCFESHASGEGLVRMAKKYLSETPDYEGVLKEYATKNSLTTRDIFNAYYEKDPIAERVIHEAIDFWGMAVSNLISIFNPDKVLFGGGVFDAAAVFLDDIKNEAKYWAQPIAFKQASIELAALGNEAGIYGAGYLAILENNKTPHV